LGKFLYLERPATIFWILFVFTVLTIIGMQVTGGPLKTDAAPAGIVTFELIGSAEGSQKIIDSWKGDIMTYAGINMGLDFLFLALYGITIALGCLIVSDKIPSSWVYLKKVGIWFAAGAIFAAFLDIIENIAMIKLLLGSHNQFLPVLAKWCAIPKFSLVLFSVLYIIGGLVTLLGKSGTHKLVKA